MFGRGIHTRFTEVTARTVYRDVLARTGSPELASTLADAFASVIGDNRRRYGRRR